jgi:hypothetical protein
MNGVSRGAASAIEPGGVLCPISISRSRAGFSSKATICPLRLNRTMPIDDASSIETGWAAMVMSARRSMCASTSSV